jgi:3-phenylpropionate/cinnamic acid dioxygenase small subunit
MTDAAEYLEVVDLLARYAHALDTDRLEDWVGFFTPDAHYKVITMESVAQNLPAGIMLCHGHGMLRDRVAYLRKAGIFNYHRDRHILSHPVIETEGDALRVHTGFTVYQSEPDRESRLFALGYYDDRIVRVQGQLKLASRTVVLDNNSVTPLLATPL